MTGIDYRNKANRTSSQTSKEKEVHSAVHHVMSYRLLKGMIVLLATVLLWGVISWILSSVPLRRVQVEGLTRYSEEEILAASGLAEVKRMREVEAESVKQTLTAFYPYISSVRLRYSFPFDYRLHIEEEAPVYYTCIAGDSFALSADLKVLERATSTRRFKEEGLRQISLGGIQSAILGQTLNYGGDFLEQVLTDIDESVLADRVTDVRIGDRYHLSVVCDDRYTLYLGDIDAIKAKLQLGALMLQQVHVPEGYRAMLDVSDLKKTSIRYEGMQDAALAVSE